MSIYDTDERGNLTPANPNVTLTVNSDIEYTILDHVVTFSTDVRWPSPCTDTNTAKLTNLPAAGIGQYQFGLVVTNLGVFIAAQMAPGATEVSFVNMATGLSLTNADLADCRVQITMTYQAA